jgi:hypothetical protein
MERALAGRAIAAVGVVLGLVAIWTHSLPGGANYWSDGTFGGFLLILMILTALLLAGGYTTGRRDLDTTAGVIGTIALGMFLYLPVLFAFNHWKDIGAGAFIGLGTVAIPLGVWMMHGATMPATMTHETRSMGGILAVIGMVLLVIGIWTHTTTRGGTYWTTTGLGHNAGICLLVMAILTVVLVVAAYGGTMPWASDAALTLAALTLGFTLFYPVGLAFNHLGQLRVGGWLATAGGIVLLLGIEAMRGTVHASRTHRTTAPAM